MSRPVTVTLALEDLQAVVDEIGAIVSLRGLADDHPLGRAEYALDSALLAEEQADAALAHEHAHEAGSASLEPCPPGCEG